MNDSDFDQGSSPYHPPNPPPAPPFPPQQQPYPPGPPGTPRVWPWYVTYCVLMALLYAVCSVAGVFLLLNAESIAEGSDDEPLVFTIQGVIFAVLGVVLFALFAVAPFLPKKKFAWIYGFVTIGLGLTSACCMPATIPLLIFWLKDDTKRFFNA